MNRLKGEVPLVLKDGREFVLVFDMEAMLSVEDNTGKPLPTVMTQASEGFLTARAAIAQAAFARFHPEVTRADVLGMLRTDQLALNDALGGACEAAFADFEEAEGNAPPPENPQAGKTSGGNGAKPVSNPKRSGKRPSARSS